MTLAATPATASVPLDRLAPLLLPEGMRLRPEPYSCGEGFAYEQVCAANPEAVLALDADGHRITMRPSAGKTSIRNGELLLQLKRFATKAGDWKVLDSSGGLLLADGSMRSPDASLVRLERWQALHRRAPARPMDCTTENTYVPD